MLERLCWKPSCSQVQCCSCPLVQYVSCLLDLPGSGSHDRMLASCSNVLLVSFSLVCTAWQLLDRSAWQLTARCFSVIAVHLIVQLRSAWQLSDHSACQQLDCGGCELFACSVKPAH